MSSSLYVIVSGFLNLEILIRIYTTDQKYCIIHRNRKVVTLIGTEQKGINSVVKYAKLYFIIIILGFNIVKIKKL